MRDGTIPDRLVRPPGRAGGPHRRRHRHAVEPHRPYQDLDLCGQPPGLARRSRALAGGHARRRGQAVRRAARAADRTLRRPPHQRADAAAEREHDARDRHQQDRRGGGRRPCHRPARWFHVHARPPRPPARKRRRSPAPRRRRSPARSTRAPRGCRRRADDQFVLASDGTIRWLGQPVGKLVAGEEVLQAARAHHRRRASHRRAARRGAGAARSLAQGPYREAARARCSSLPPPRT